MRVFATLDMEFPRESTCVALGLFDGLHPGHMQVIRAAVEKARELRKVSCVFTYTVSGALPGNKVQGRLLSDTRFYRILEELGVECVIRPDFSEFCDLEPERFAEEFLRGRMGACHVACGEDFRFGKGAAGTVDTLRRQFGGADSLTVLPMVRQDGGTVSSSRIREFIQAGEIETANAMLGRRFAIDFEVVHGRALGRTLGSPTINQPFPADFVVPRFGVYATLTHWDGREYVSVTNVGVKPTVGSDHVLAETYIHGFSGDLYSMAVDVEFLRFIRPEQKFAGVEELREQILRDSETAEQIAAGMTNTAAREH
ncbi:riboflavin biosynthesis protein RibF [Ruminococcaceae bacterium OttesenSCG-928-L11]|nr:riboflavin biosynthesis protein RibF [Ruminococcaceae bacterium OttesenSCG-928-L11]